MNKLSEESINKLNKCIYLIDKVTTVGFSAMEKFPSGDYSLETFTFITYLERFTYNLGSVNFLLKHFEEHPYVETSIGLTIRASLLDLMTITYLMSYQVDIKSDDDVEAKNNYDKQFNTVLADQIHNSLKYIKVSKENGVIAKEQYNTILDNLWYTYRFLFTCDEVDFEKPESKLISTEFKSPKQYFVRIHNHPIVKVYSHVYDYYTYYSKYDHSGIMTHFMQREDINHDLDRIIETVKYMIRGIGSTFVFLSFGNNKLEAEKIDLRKFQDEFDLL